MTTYSDRAPGLPVVPREPRGTHGRPVVFTAALLLASVATLASCSPDGSSGGGGASPDRPNVLLVVIDTLRADRCGFVGYDRPTTPQIDRVASAGAAFTNAWTPAGWTGPAHASLFTGQRPEHHRMMLGSEQPLPEEAVTLAELLSAAGYRTGAVSCNGFVTNDFRLLQGFQETEFIPGAARSVEHLGIRAVESTNRFIDKGGAPWFAFMNVMEPHLTYAPPWAMERQFVAEGAPKDRVRALRGFDFPRTISHMLGIDVLPADDLRLLGDLYDAEIAAADAALGRLFDRLREKGEIENTLIVVTSDHGENLGEHGLIAHRFSLHRPILHVPLVIRWPKRFRPGTVETRPVRLEDVFPTVLEICGVPVPAEIDGASLTSNLDGRIARAIQGPIPAEFTRRVATLIPGAELGSLGAGIRSVYDGRHHLIRHDDGREELYDVETDPEEAFDLSATKPAVVEQLRPLLPVRTPR